MVNNKERTTRIDQTDILGQKPPASIGEGRTPQEAKIVGKLKKRVIANKSTASDGAKANVANVTDAIGRMVNK